jgi:hypothetical protein
MKKSDKNLIQIFAYHKGKYYLNMEVWSHYEGDSAPSLLVGMFLTKLYDKETELTASNDTKYKIKEPNLIVCLIIKSTHHHHTLQYDVKKLM